MPNLNDTQTLLLSHAANSDGGAFYPLPATRDGAPTRAATAIAALIKLGYAEERETSDASAVTRTDGDLSYGTYVTPAGLAAIGVEDSAGKGEGASLTAHATVAPRSSTAPTKAQTVLTLLRRSEGATLADLIAATGWLPHTTRAALTGLRKKGHVLAKGKRADATCYRIENAA